MITEFIVQARKLHELGIFDAVVELATNQRHDAYRQIEENERFLGVFSAAQRDENWVVSVCQFGRVE